MVTLMFENHIDIMSIPEISVQNKNTIGIFLQKQFINIDSSIERPAVTHSYKTRTN